MYPAILVYPQKIKLENEYKIENVYKSKMSTKFDSQVEKITKKNVWGNFKIKLKIFCCRHQKNASYTILIYEKYMISFFFDKKNSFFIWNDTPNFMSKQDFYVKTT